MVQQIIDKKTYLARIFVGMLVMFFVLVPALSATCVSPQAGPPAVVAADSNLLPLSANVPVKDCCLKNKLHLPPDQWAQNCGWTTVLLFSDILKPSSFETQPVNFSLPASSFLILSTALQEFRSSSQPSLSNTDISPLFAQKTALLI